jgi:hypothetical protein
LVVLELELVLVLLKHMLSLDRLDIGQFHPLMGHMIKYYSFHHCIGKFEEHR